MRFLNCKEGTSNPECVCVCVCVVGKEGGTLFFAFSMSLKVSEDLSPSVATAVFCCAHLGVWPGNRHRDRESKKEFMLAGH